MEVRRVSASMLQAPWHAKALIPVAQLPEVLLSIQAAITTAHGMDLHCFPPM